MFVKFNGVEIFVGRVFFKTAGDIGIVDVQKTSDGFEVTLFRRYYVVISYPKGAQHGNKQDNHPSSPLGSSEGVQGGVQD